MNLGIQMSIKNKAKDRDESGRICRKYTGPSLNWPVPFPGGCPKSWRKMYMTRPARRESKALCHKVVKGYDYDDMTFPLSNNKPHEYFW